MSADVSQSHQHFYLTYSQTMFSKNSLPKIILLSDEATVSFAYEVEAGDWFQKNFDVIRCQTAREAYDVLVANRDSVTALVSQNKSGWQAYSELDKLPNYFKRRWYHFNDYANHGKEVYDAISFAELTGEINPLYSFITPLYNTNLKYFEHLYNSLAYQTINDWEWVLLDDSPEPLEWVKELAKHDIRLRYFRLDPVSGGNIGSAKQRAFCLARGNWLIELDHDDMLPYWCLHYLKEAIDEFPECGFFYSDTTDIDGDNKFIIAQYGEGFAYGFCNSYVTEDPDGNALPSNDTAEINSATIRHIVGVPNHFRCWRRDVYFKAGMHNPNLRIADDYELVVRTFLETIFCHIKYPCYYQRFDGGNSQDANGGVNRADIQRRVYLIAEAYNELIHNRMEELAGEPSWDPSSAERTIAMNLPETEPIWVNKIFTPAFLYNK